MTGHSSEDRPLLPSPSPELLLTDLGFLRQARRHHGSLLDALPCA